MPLAQLARPMSRGRPPRSFLPHGRRAESFADDLNTQRAIVSGRVALLPRSTEIQPRVARIRPTPLYPHSHLQARARRDGQRRCEQAIVKIRETTQGKTTQVTKYPSTWTGKNVLFTATRWYNKRPRPKCSGNAARAKFNMFQEQLCPLVR
jgi:hypothetical protein